MNSKHTRLVTSVYLSQNTML
uniref:Uncharacterized protein n=1 Tax=Arundo donax TaxID=35708 RepID=A0A0A9C7W9_ARUDO